MLPMEKDGKAISQAQAQQEKDLRECPYTSPKDL